MIRILFVDDEPRVLEGLKRSLRRQRKVWSMSFAEGGEAGVRELDTGDFDVVVSDMRMPKVDGYALLSHAQQVQPDAMRIVLSGQTELEAALRTVPVAHQFLSKPCEGDQVRMVIERAIQMRKLFQDQRLREVISRAGSLPSVPELYIQLTHALQDPEISAMDIAEIIERDLGMSTKILQIVNSAFFGLPRQMTRLRDAVAFLGVKLIRAMVLSEEAFRPFVGKGVFTAADLYAEQRRGLRTATLARKLSPDRSLGDQAFLAGMLHDIGWVIAGCLLPDEYRQCQARAVDGVVPTCVEREVLGATHAEIGAFLLGTWGLPLPVVEGVAFHHEPRAVAHDEFEVITAVHVAAALLGEAEDGMRERAPKLDQRYLHGLGLQGSLDEWRRIAGEENEREDAA